MSVSPWIKWQQAYLWASHLWDEESPWDPTHTPAWRDEAFDLYVQWFNRWAQTQDCGRGWSVRRWDEDWMLPETLNYPRRWVIRLLSHNQILVLPSSHLLVLPQDTFNTLIEAAAIAWWLDFNPKLAQDLYQADGDALLWWQMMVYFLTKWVNPNRRVEKLHQIRQRFHKNPQASRLEARIWQSWIQLGRWATHPRRAHGLSRLGLDTWLVTRYLGRILGDRLYHLQALGEIPIKEIQNSLQNSFAHGVLSLKQWLPTLWSWDYESPPQAA